MSWCETECKKNVPLVKQNVMKLEVFIKTKNSEEKEGRGRRERIEKGSRERIEIERKETKRK